MAREFHNGKGLTFHEGKYYILVSVNKTWTRTTNLKNIWDVRQEKGEKWSLYAAPKLQLPFWILIISKGHTWVFTMSEMATHSSTLAWRIPWMEEPTVRGVTKSRIWLSDFPLVLLRFVDITVSWQYNIKAATVTGSMFQNNWQTGSLPDLMILSACILGTEKGKQFLKICTG